MLSQGSHSYSELTTTSFLPLPSLETGSLCSVCHPVGQGAEVTAALGSGLPREQGPQAVGFLLPDHFEEQGSARPRVLRCDASPESCFLTCHNGEAGGTLW